MTKEHGPSAVSMAQLGAAGEHHHSAFHIRRSIQLMHLPRTDEMHAWSIDLQHFQIDHMLTRALRKEEELMEIVPMDIILNGC